MKTGIGTWAAGCGIIFLLVFSSRPVYAGIEKKSCEVACHKNPLLKKQRYTQQECKRCHNPSPHKTGPGEQIKYSRERIMDTSGDIKKSYTDMVSIPEGEFLMGTDDRLPDEKPAHVVYVEGFFIDIHEVTNEDYKKFTDHTHYPKPDHWKKGSYPEGKGRHPVTFVTWHDADNYCGWAGKRLPGEKEWEKAARGTDGRVYPWGNRWDMYKSNNPLRAMGDTQPVGTYENGKSPYGLYDMSGNVWEWVDDYYLAHPGSDYINPEFGSDYRILKGGSWWDCSAYGCGISAPTYNRAFFDPMVKSESYGFRCARSNN